ncbi:MAG: Gfo/Idh/MocA family oxidoreductase [Bacteroidia bacterium]|nr:Gfo/Idh/MocA family oxidoreductase [Bacteroidia bacterium]
MTAAPLRWGILATGKIARKFAQGLQTLPDAVLQAAGSRSLEAARAFAAEFQIPHAHGSYEALVADPTVDIVYVASPHVFHREHTLLALRHGKHVLCEKPFAMHAGEAEEMAAEARARGLFLMEAMWTRFLPAWVQARKWIAEGRIGSIRLLQADFSFLSAGFDPEDRKYSPALGGGALLDIGIYPVSLSYMLFGREPADTASLAHLGRTGVDEQSAYLFRYDQGELAVLSCSFDTHGTKEAVVCGDKARIRVPLFWRARQAILETNDEILETFDGGYPATGLQYQAAEAMQCIREGRTESALMPLDETLRIMRRLDRLRGGWGLRYPGE